MSRHDTLIAEIPRLRRYARALTGAADTADDLVQDTLTRAIEKWSFWQSSRALRPWLFSIMHNVHVDRCRRQGVVEMTDDGELPDIAVRPAQADALELRDLDRALALLPLAQREVLLMVALEDMAYADVARALSIPQGTVMSRLARARARLRAIIDGDVVAGPSAGDGAPQLKLVSS